MTTIIKCYSELISKSTFQERFEYLALSGVVGQGTFGGRRVTNQDFYRSREWKDTRRKIILRDNGCDLGLEGHEIHGEILIHHINPVTIDDLRIGRDIVFDPENLITVSFGTHNAIHFGSYEMLSRGFVAERSPNDTCPWR